MLIYLAMRPAETSYLHRRAVFDFTRSFAWSHGGYITSRCGRRIAFSSEIPSSLYIRRILNRQWHCWSLRCSWSIACRRCSNYIFIIDLTVGFNGLDKEMRRDSVKFWDLVPLILDILRYLYCFEAGTKWPFLLTFSNSHGRLKLKYYTTYFTAINYILNSLRPSDAYMCQ